EELVRDARLVNHLDLGIDAEVDGELLEGLDPAVAAAVAADDGALPPAGAAADLAAEAGATLPDLHRLHHHVAEGVLLVAHLRPRAEARAVAERAVDLPEALAAAAGGAAEAVAARAGTDVLGVRNRHDLGAILEVGRPAGGQVPGVRRPAVGVDGAALEGDCLLAHRAVLVLRLQADRVRRARHHVLDGDLAAQAPHAEEALRAPLVDEVPGVRTAERNR